MSRLMVFSMIAVSQGLAYMTGVSSHTTITIVIGAAFALSAHWVFGDEA